MAGKTDADIIATVEPEETVTQKDRKKERQRLRGNKEVGCQSRPTKEPLSDSVGTLGDVRNVSPTIENSR